MLKKKKLKKILQKTMMKLKNESLTNTKKSLLKRKIK